MFTVRSVAYTPGTRLRIREQGEGAACILRDGVPIYSGNAFWVTLPTNSTRGVSRSKAAFASHRAGCG